MSGELRVHVGGADLTFAVDDDGLTRVAPDMVALLFVMACDHEVTVDVERDY